MIKIILYIAISADGFIADKNGSVEWLDKYNNGSSQDCGFRNFYDSIDALVFGKNTYNQVLTFGPWPYPGKKSYIFADKDVHPINSDVEIIDTDIVNFVKKVDESGIKRLWLMGGAQLIDSFDKLDCIDEYFFTIMPDLLGSGIALSEHIFHPKNFKLVDTIMYPDFFDIVQKQYKK